MSPELRRGRHAFTLLEALVACVIGVVITVVTATALVSASRVLTKSSGRDAATRELHRARAALTRDLSQVRLQPDAFRSQPAPASLGGGADGDYLNFLSAVNITSGAQQPLEDGSGNPYLFVNVFYYPTIPSNHDALFGQSCTGGNNGGYDDQCAHKILLRCVEDQNPAYDPSDPGTQDVLHPGLTGLMTRPINFPKTPTRTTVGINLLTFRAQTLPGELRITLKAVSLAEARRKLALGTTSLDSSRFTLEQVFSVFPRS